MSVYTVCLSIVYLILQLHAVTQIKIIVITTTISADHSDHYPALMSTISAEHQGGEIIQIQSLWQTIAITTLH